MKQKHPIAFKRFVLKLSGESLLGKSNFGINPAALTDISKTIAEVVELGAQTAIVIGGGNLFRGGALARIGFDRIASDHMGMLATVINGLALRDGLSKCGVPTNVMSAIPINSIVESYDRYTAISYLEKGHVVIFVAGTGCPLFSTDSVASLRAVEIDANIILKATKVDGVYSGDPHVDKTATLLDHVSYQEIVEQRLGVMDLSAICICHDHKIPIRVFNMNKKNVLKGIVKGADYGTLIS